MQNSFFHKLKFFPALLLVLIFSFLISGCDVFKKRYYYAFEFEAEVEGELFAFKTKVACEPVKASGGIGSKTSIFYGAERLVLGKELTDGKGFFVVVPYMCGWLKNGKIKTWTFEKNYPVIPLMYFSNNYQKPNQIRVLVDPEGPDPETGVNLINALVSPLEGKDIQQVEKLENNQNAVKFSAKGAKGEGWKGLFLFPFEPFEDLKQEQQIMTSEDDRYHVFYYPGKGWAYDPEKIKAGETKPEFWSVSGHFYGRILVGIPLNEVFKLYPKPDIHVGFDFQKDLNNYLGFAKYGFKNLYPLGVEKNTITTDFSVRGVIIYYKEDFLNRNLMFRNDPATFLRIGINRALVVDKISQIRGIVFYDTLEKKYYKVQRGYF